MVNLDKFKQVVKEIGCYNRYIDKKYSYYRCWNFDKQLKNLDECYIYIEWSTGGVSGGSCWDTGEEDNHYCISGEKEPEFEDLDNLLTKLCPNITFLQYKSLMSKVIEIDNFTRNEYYGNYTEYCTKMVNLGKLYKVMNEMGL